MRFNFTRMVSNHIARAVVNSLNNKGTSTSSKSSSTSDYITNKAVRTIRRSFWKPWKW
jgi:hypothetical protein